MICQITGTVVGLLDRGFLLHTGDGEPITVTTQTAGCDLGWSPGDVVEVLEGPVGRSIFASSTAFKVLPSAKSIEIPVNTAERPGRTQTSLDDDHCTKQQSARTRCEITGCNPASLPASLVIPP